MDLHKLCNETIIAVKEVASFIRQARIEGFEVKEKSVNSLVTHIDENAERQLIQKLKLIVPAAGIIGEEGIANNKTEDLNWVIDPLDGTTNFIHGVPCYSISIALMDAKEVLIGVVYEINLDECFYAWKNGGAFLNGTPISVSQNGEMKNALVATGFPYYDYEKADEYLALLKEFMKTSRGIRRLGSAAVDLAYVACGRFDGFFEYSLNAWDVAAGSLIVQEAGGCVVDFSGDDDYIFGREIVATSKAIFPPFLKTIRNHF